MNETALAAFIAPREGGNATMVFLIQMVAIFAIFYFLLIRPQKKEQERHRSMLDALKKGDEIVTSGGIIGTVVHAEEDRVTIRTAETTRIVVERQRIVRVGGGPGKGQAVVPVADEKIEERTERKERPARGERRPSRGRATPEGPEGLEG